MKLWFEIVHCECECNVTWRKCREQIVPRCRPLLTFSCSGSTLIHKCRSAVISYHTNLFALSTCIERVSSLFRIEKEYINSGWWHFHRCITTYRSQPNKKMCWFWTIIPFPMQKYEFFGEMVPWVQRWKVKREFEMCFVNGGIWLFSYGDWLLLKIYRSLFSVYAHKPKCVCEHEKHLHGHL